jgi:O-succinylhomoserine sulfhydrylase
MLPRPPRDFPGAEPGNVYARFTNPTVTNFQERLAALEGAEACVATATGMAAILATVMALMKAGEHIVASRSIFGATQQLFGTILPRFGIETSFVDQGTIEAFAPQCGRPPNWCSSRLRRIR